MGRIKLIAVCEYCKTPEESLSRIYTIVNTKKEAREYILCLLHLRYFSHFDAWCELHNQDKDSKDVFNDYIYKVYDGEPFNEFALVNLYYTKQQLCSLLRKLAQFIPVGASYELDDEIESYMSLQDENKESECSDCKENNC